MAARFCCVVVGLGLMTTCIEGTLRLIGGDDQYEGRLEVYHDGEWQLVCSDYWNDDNAIVACRQLGLKGGSWEDGNSGDGTFWLTDVNCDGSEDRLENCKSKPIVSTKCKHRDNDYVYQTCRPPKDGVLRLQDGPIQNGGRLEIYHDDEWGAVCYDKWTTHPQNARVACRQLGYEGGSSRRAKSSEYKSSLDFWMDDVKCLGNETRIQDCSFRGWGIENCYYYSDQIYLECDEYKDNLTRLVGGSNQYEGRLEVYHAGQWGSVCIHRWENSVLNAHVACRQLGYTGGSFRPVTATERGEGQFWMNGIECNGDEVNLNHCYFNGWSSENCSHSENDDVFLQCNPNKGSVQLINGTNRYNGLVQVFDNGNWISLCNDDWTNNNLNVVCRQLGTMGNRSESKDYSEGYYYPGDFQCSGSEEYLIKCSYFKRTCSSIEKVVVTCRIPASPRNGRCEIDLQETCDETLTCQEVNGFGRCVCNNESYWDGSKNKCKEKLLFNEMCDPFIDDVCTSDLLCKPANGSTEFKCICPENNFWDTSLNQCRTKFVFNEMCDPLINDVCTSDLSCKPANGSAAFKCICLENNFWDTSLNQCRTKILYTGDCDPAYEDACTSDLSCDNSEGTTPNLYQCICPDENDFWDSSLRACRKRTSLQGIYVTDRMNITDAITRCENNYQGQLATEEHRLHVFSNCMDFAEDIWVIDISYVMAETFAESCANLNQDGDLKIGNCTERRAFVCISKRNNRNDPSCVGFPTAPATSFHGDSSKSSAGLIGGLIAALIVLAGVIMLVIWFTIRRRRTDKCNMDGSLTENQAYCLHGAVDENAFKMESRSVDKSEIQYEEKYDYATGATKRYTHDRNHLNMYANDQESSDMTEEQYEKAGEFNPVYSVSDGMHTYANYGHIPPNDVSEHYSLKESFPRLKPTDINDNSSPSTDDLPEEEYNTFSDKHDDLPPSDTYDHVHNVEEGEYNQLQLRSSDRSQFTQHDDLLPSDTYDHIHNVEEGDYNQFQLRSSDRSQFTQHDDLPPSDTYDHVHNVEEGEYNQFQLRSSYRSNCTADEENGYMNSTFPA